MGDFRPRNNGRFSRDRSGGFGNRGGFGGNRGRFSRNRDFSRDRPKPEMHEVTCDKCHKQCQVPFNPSGDKPVYCSACFENKGNSRTETRGNSSAGISAEQFNQINAKLDKILQVLADLEVVPADEDEEDFEDEDDSNSA
jgi:CxxC-x17-CxxC domain-containing protein